MAKFIFLAILGSVTDLIHARFTFGIPESAIGIILYELLRAIDYVHSRDYIHRGVRCSHILINSDGRVALSGFRNAISVLQDGKRVSPMHDFRSDFKASLLWLAPEVLQQNLGGYGTKSDIYSVGISACEMANGFPPFSDMTHMQMLFEKLRGTTPRLLDASTLGDVAEGVTTEQNDRRFSSHLHNFTELCLKPDPAERPTAAELLSHSLFKHVKRHRPSFGDLFHPTKPLAPPDCTDSARNSMDPTESVSNPIAATAASSSAGDSTDYDGNIEWQFE